MFGESSLSGISDDEELNGLCRNKNNNHEYQSAMNGKHDECDELLENKPEMIHAGKGVLEASMAEIDADMVVLNAFVNEIGSSNNGFEARGDGPPPPLLLTAAESAVKGASEDGPPPLTMGIPIKANEPTISDTFKANFVEMGSEWIRFCHENQKKTLAEGRRKLAAKFNADRDAFRVKLLDEIKIKMEKERAEYDAQLSKQAAEGIAKFVEDLEKSVVDAKKRQWCKVCFTEAIYACCWNTSYCSVECQGRHWPMHMHSCRRNKKQ